MANRTALLRNTEMQKEIFFFAFSTEECKLKNKKVFFAANVISKRDDDHDVDDIVGVCETYVMSGFKFNCMQTYNKLNRENKVQEMNYRNMFNVNKH